MKWQDKELRWTFSLLLLGVAGRLFPHLPGFAPVGAISLFGGARLRGWRGYALPLLIMAITAPILGAYRGFTPFDLVTPFVYGSFLVNVWIGRHLRDTRSPWWIGGATLTGSLQFFIITNFGMWTSGISFYPLTYEGLAACYIGALPYLGKTIASDLLYSSTLFGLHAYLTRMPSVRSVTERTVS